MVGHNDMNDMDDENKLNKFTEDDNDLIKPIDTGHEQKSDTPAAPEIPEAGAVPPFPDSDLPPEAKLEAEQPTTDAPTEAEPFLKDDDWPPEEDKKEAVPPPEEKGGDTPHDSANYISKGEYIDLLEKDPTMKNITIGAGWDQKAFEEEPVDVDLSLFLLDKTEMTRIDEDFIFYNNDRACEGAIQHLMDNRTGAGEGDDENVFIDLNGVPFDIVKIIFVFSIYDPEIKGHHFGMVKNMFFSITNKDDGQEIARYRIDPDDQKGGNAMIVTTLIREGPKWILEASADVSNAGLAKVATDYGIIIKELQTTGEETLGEETAQEASGED